MDKEKLKKNFDEFLSLNWEDFEKKRVDYLGVNISSDCTSKPVFKIYYNDKFSRTKSHPLIDFLEDKEMIRYLTMVQDKKEPQRLRFDVGLKNRTNKNMLEVYEWLSEHTLMFGDNQAEIKKLSSMKTTNLANYDLAGLYFLGFISVDESISILKCHYFNRICENPDILHKNYSFADDYYLSFLSECGIREFAEMCPLLRKALKYCGGHLWMTGADYSVSSSRKYKIYIKNPVDLYGGLIETFEGDEHQYLRKYIINVMSWNEQHKEFYCEGFAICINEQASISINFYFKTKDK